MEASKLELKQVVKSFNLLNCCLIAASLIFVYSFLLPQLNSDVAFVTPPLKKKSVEKAPSELPKVQSPSPMDYVVIADENLFHPERRIPPEKKDEVVLPKPEFVLFGTLIMPNVSIAYLEDKKAPVTTPGRGKRQTALKKGESLSGFTLREVLADKVVLARGEETLTVLLNDLQSPKTREAAGITSPPAQIPGIPGSSSPSPMAGQPSRPPLLPGPGVPPSSMTPGPPIPPSQAMQPGLQPTPNGRGAFPSRRQFPPQ
jgi:hypothetical protein